jgi:outer membrane protein TolC
MNKTYLCIAITALCTAASAEDSSHYMLSIEDLFSMADHANKIIRANNTAIEASQKAALAAKSAALPSIDASWQAGYIGNGMITDRNFTNRIAVQMPHLANNFSIEASQVIFAGGAINNAIKVADLQEQMAFLAAQQNKKQIRFLIAANYLELCRLKNQLKVLNSNIIQTQNALQTIYAKVKAGTALNSDALRYELQLENLYFAKKQLENSILLTNSQLISAAGLPKDAVIEPDSTISTTSRYIIASQYSNEDAMEVKIAANAENIAAYEQKIVRSEYFPSVVIFAGGYLNSPIMTEIPVLNNNFMYWAAGVSIKYSIGSLYKSRDKNSAAELSKRRAGEKKEAAMEHSLLQIEEARVHYEESFVLLGTKEKSMELARANYDIIYKRYENDLALIIDLLDASAQKLDAELQTINARINIAYNFYKLKFAAGDI